MDIVGDRARPARVAGRHPSAAATAIPESPAYPVIIVLLLIVTVLPFHFEVSEVLLNPSRLLLMALIAPAMFRWASGKVGKPLLSDWFILAFGFWMLICLVMNQGLGRTGVYWGSQFVEVVGAYFVGRAFIVSQACFVFMARGYLVMVMLMLPIAFYENLTGEVIYLDWWGAIPGLTTPESVMYGPRLGLYRAQVAFSHPILYGVVVSTAFAFAWYLLQIRGRSLFVRLIASGLVTVGTVSSMSAGALVSVVTQMALISWDWLLRGIAARWKIFFGLIAFAYIVIDLISNRSPFAAVLSRLTFNSSTAYNRIRIWDFGTDEVMRNPIFGMGLFTNWIRPRFMSPSIDNHWLLMAMRYGLPGIAMLLGAFVWVIYKISVKISPEDPRYIIGRAAIFALSGAIIALATVAAFASTFSLIIFLLGAATFLLRDDPPGAPVDTENMGAAVPDRSRSPRRSTRDPGAGVTGASEDDAAPPVPPQPAATRATAQSRYTRFSEAGSPRGGSRR